ncbi:MAG: membrane protein insertase YidC, partial [Deltaproteobacteria bacterium]|nr:membrane protein insertase YidC [Deltaproteobacteria bacterium]
MNQSRMFLAVALSMAVFFAYAKWFAPPPPSAPPAPKPAEQTVPPSPLAKIPPFEKGGPGGIFPAGEGTDVILENGRVKAVFSTAGGVLTDFILKDYGQTAEKDSAPINLLNEGNGQAFLLTLENEVHDRGVLYSSESDSNKIVFEWKSTDLDIRKTYQLRPDNPHMIDLSVEVTSRGGNTLEPRLWISREQKKEEKSGGFFSFLKQKPDFYIPMQFIGGKFQAEQNWQKLPSRTEERGQVYWAGLSDRYFLLSLISRLDSSSSIVRYGKEEGKIYTSLSYG